MQRFVVILSNAASTTPRGDLPGMIVESFESQDLAQDFAWKHKGGWRSVLLLREKLGHFKVIERYRFGQLLPDRMDQLLS